MPIFEIAMTLTVEAPTAEKAGIVAENFERVSSVFDEWSEAPEMFGFIPNYGAAPGRLKLLRVGVPLALVAWTPVPVPAEVAGTEESEGASEDEDAPSDFLSDLDPGPR